MENISIKYLKENKSLLMEFFLSEIPTIELCLEVLKIDGTIISAIKDPPIGLCLEAVKQNGLAIKFIKKQTEKICLEAYKQNKEARKYFKIPLTDEMLLEMIANEV